MLRDPTRGGLATPERDRGLAVGIMLKKQAPGAWTRAGPCEMLGLDPMYVANEGKLVAIVPPHVAEPMLARMRAHGLGQQAALIGSVTDRHAGVVAARTALGTTRMVPMQIGEQLPRIC